MQPPAPFDEPFTLEAQAIGMAEDWQSEKIAATIFSLDDPEGRRFGLRDIGPPPGSPPPEEPPDPDLALDPALDAALDSGARP